MFNLADMVGIIQYGNQASIGCVYTLATMFIRVPPINDRATKHTAKPDDDIYRGIKGDPVWDSEDERWRSDESSECNEAPESDDRTVKRRKCTPKITPWN
jgi:hypothetical protein